MLGLEKKSEEWGTTSPQGSRVAALYMDALYIAV